MTDICKDCGKPGFSDKAGAMQHDRRGTQGSAPDGKERRLAALPTPPPAPKIEKPPRREHWLHQKWFGLVRD